jgi:hypothetical protein
LDVVSLCGGAGERGEVDPGQIVTCKNAATARHERTVRAAARGGLKNSWLPEEGVRQNDGSASLLSRNPHPEEIASGGEIRDRVALDEIAPLPID